MTDLSLSRPLERYPASIPEDVFQGSHDFDGVQGLVFLGPRVLIYRRDTKTPRYPLHLSLPGGGREENETAFETFRREVNEEFSLEVRAEDVIYGKYYPSDDDLQYRGYFLAAQLEAEAAERIVFGSEGLVYHVVDLEFFLTCPDAWPINQQRAREYAAGASF
jgi:8-oxo-dGTP diphosphatase